MDPATGAIGRLLPKLDELDELLHQSMMEEVASLKERLTTIQSDLGYVKNHVSEPMKSWSREARDLSYHIEQVVDRFRARQLMAGNSTAAANKDKIPKIGYSYRLAMDKASRQFATEFSGFSHKLTELIGDKPRLLGDPVVGELRDQDDPVFGELSVQEGSSAGGLHSRVQKLVNILMDEGATSNQQLKVASILGMPGVGKTTLANLVYTRLKPRFECSAWITVSNKRDVKNVLRNMLSQITPQGDANFGSTNIQEIIDEIRKALKDKRYFIVFDDMCDNKAWEIIKSALVDVSNMSAVLMTSRKVSVARYAGGIIYRLKSLSGKALEDRDTVVDTNTGAPVPSSVPPRVGVTRVPLYTLLQGPSLSTLPGNLIPCLMYFGMFQKGHEIGTDHLLCGWIAEGFIPGEVGMTLREQGESYLSDLISRGFLVAGCKARSFRLRDEELHRSITSLSAEKNSVTIVDGQQVTHVREASVSRLSIQGNNTLSPQAPLSRVRSLVVSGDANPFRQETGGTNSVLSLPEIENLIVLDLGGCASLKNDHLNGIERLLLLKYLVLGGDCTIDIPRQIGSLVFLQTLDLKACRVKELPDSIACARTLECLLVNWHTKIPDAIGKMKALQVLGDINISRGQLLEELRNLPALRVLKIVIWSWDDTYGRVLLQYLGSLSSQKIQCLSIFISCSLDFMEKLDAESTPDQRLQELEIRHSTFENLPKWISSLKLTSLSIELHKLSQTIIEMLGKLDTLASLYLTSKHAPEGTFRRGFINLTSFHLVSSALGTIFVQRGMEKLERLHLSFQASLTKDFKFGLENLSSLEHIHVEIICFNASSKVVQDIEKAITTAIPSGGAELVIDKVWAEDMAKNEDGQETQGCFPDQYFDQIKKFNLDQRQALEKVGFADLLKMKGVKVLHKLSKRLAEAYDVQSEAFNIGGSMVQISIEDVGRLMGIPSKGKAIVEIPKMKNLVLLSSYKDKNGTISLDTLQADLSSNNDSNEHFIRRVLLYTIGMLLCPTTQRIVSSDYLSLLENVEEIKTINWASLTLHHLKDSLKRYKTGKANIEGNLVLLQLWYWEKLYINKPDEIKYSKDEDVALVRAWKCVSLDAVTGNDETVKKYWQRIEYKFHQFMPVPSTLSLRSLKDRYDVVEQCCSRWSDCLEKVRKAPTSGCTTNDYDRFALERYMQMPESKGEPFVLQHCWKILECSEKWRLRDREAPPKKEAFVTLNDEQDSDEQKERNKGKLNGRKKEKSKKKADASSLREKNPDMKKSKDTLVAQQLQEKLEIAEKKQQDKVTKWQKKWEDEKRKADFEERKILLEENKVMVDNIAEENRVMMMDPNGMDVISREWWEIRRMEILQRRRQESGGVSASCGV